MTSSRTLEVHVDCDEGCFELPAWRELFARDGKGHIFATPEWNRLWWEEFGDGKDLLLLTIKADDTVIALCPLYRKLEDGKKILRWVGGIDLTDYLGPICSPADKGEVADCLVRWLGSTDVEWDEFDAHNMPVPFGFTEFLVERADHAGFGFALQQEETAAILRLPSSWDDYLASLGSKQRHELKRKRRRIEREHPDTKLRASTPETLAGDLKIFFDMHRGAEGMKGHFMKTEIATFFERIAAAFSDLGWLRLDFLEIGDAAVASTFGFELNGTLYLYNSAYDPDLARLSPGLILVSELVSDAIDRDLEVFDFLRGPEHYKYQLGAEAIPLNNVQIFKDGDGR